MAISGGGSDQSGHTSLSEINITPLVDVMLVLLTIFMVASSVETIQVAAEKEKLLKEQKDEEQRTQLLTRLEKLQEERVDTRTQQHRDQRRLQYMQLQEERLKEVEEKLEDKSQNVPIDLPKATSEAINLAEQKKIVVTFTREHEFFIGETRVVDCGAAEFRDVKAPAPVKEEEGEEPQLGAEAYNKCLKVIERKLVANQKLKEEGECYLRADRKLDYGRVLRLMATIRKAGVTKFGLVSEALEDEESGVTAAAGSGG